MRVSAAEALDDTDATLCSTSSDDDADATLCSTSEASAAAGAECVRRNIRSGPWETMTTYLRTSKRGVSVQRIVSCGESGPETDSQW